MILIICQVCFLKFVFEQFCFLERDHIGKLNIVTNPSAQIRKQLRISVNISFFFLFRHQISILKLRSVKKLKLHR